MATPTSVLKVLLFTLVNAICLACWRAEAGYLPNFHNLTGCLYTYMNDGQYRITFSDAEEQFGQLSISKLSYDSKSRCTSPTNPGTLIMNFDNSDNNFEKLSLEFHIRQLPAYGFWDIDKVILHITPSSNVLFPNRTIELRPSSDIYAPSNNSYSCSSLILQNHFTKDGPQFKIILKRFQMQPFAESQLYVFAPSHDCSTWLTLPQIMGFALVLFIIFTALFGVYLLLELGNQQGDLRFSKHGGMLMNQAQLDATKAD